MALLKWLIGAGAAFGGLVALMYVAQRSLMYFPEGLHTPPAMAGLPEAQEVALNTKDGERVIVWHVPPRGEKPVALYFHGNGGALRNRVDRFRALIADGNGLIALSYRGYGGSTGRPTEAVKPRPVNFPLQQIVVALVSCLSNACRREKMR